MSQANVETIRGLYAAFERDDVPAVLAKFDPNIEWNEAENFLYAGGNPYVGPDAVVEGVLMPLGSEWADFSITLEEMLDAGATVVATGRYRGSYKKTGREVNAQFLHLWRLREGKVVRFQQYTDTAQFVRVAAD